MAPVAFSELLGSETLLIADLEGQEIVAKMFRPVPVEAGQELCFQLNLSGVHLFDPECGRSLRARTE